MKGYGFLLGVMFVFFLAAVSGEAFGDWSIVDGHKMHAAQLPDRTGWDICLEHQTLADDFVCSDSVPITEIHFWVSWRRDLESFLTTTWTIQILSDNKGQPGGVLWTWNSTDGDVAVRAYGTGNQGWHCPVGQITDAEDHVNYYQVNVTGIKRAFEQSRGKRYWLAIGADNTNQKSTVGWKSSSSTYNSEAVWLGGPGGWQTIGEVTYDLAFVINGQRSGVVEHDYWGSWPQRVEVILPDLTVVQASVDGSTTQDVFFEGPGDGDADDDDGDGKDEVVTELTDLNLTGGSVLGPLSVRLNPSFASMGEIEETSDVVSGWLDLPPFTFGGTASSFFDAYFEVTVDGLTMYTISPTRYSAVIDHKPVSYLDVYTADHEHLPLYDSNGVATGYSFAIGWHAIEHDYWESWPQRVELILPDSTATEPYVDGFLMQNVFFEGAVEGDADDDDGDNKDEVVTELVDLHLTGNSVLGPVSVRLNPSIASMGEIEEWSNSVTGRLDLPPFSASGAAMAFFDAYFEVTVGSLIMYTISPTRFSGLIDHKPTSDPGMFTALHKHLPLYNSLGEQTDFAFAIGPHSSEPAVETDVYDAAWASVRIQLATGGIETINLSGSMTELVYFDGPSEGDADDVDGDGRDGVDTEVVSLNLTGLSLSLGFVELRLYPDSSSPGEMTEVVNHTPGILDVAPFTMGEHVTSRIEFYVVIEINGRDYYGDGALVLTAQISHKPARSGELFVDEDKLGVDLLDAAGRPTGYRLWITQLRPSPCVRCSNFDGLGVTDMLDVKRFSEEWLWNDSGIEKYNAADMDCSGDVRLTDFAQFAMLWLTTCD